MMRKKEQFCIVCDNPIGDRCRNAKFCLKCATMRRMITSSYYYFKKRYGVIPEKLLEDLIKHKIDLR